MGKTILAIDDSRTMLELYAAILADFGNILTFETMAEARAHLAGVDLIILDFNLENDPGLIQDIVQELKNIAPIILCSGVQDARVAAYCLSLGVRDYWNKSSDYDALLSKVKRLLSAGD
jgi:DNA-binding NtrC family response regulator